MMVEYEQGVACLQRDAFQIRKESNRMIAELLFPRIAGKPLQARQSFLPVLRATKYKRNPIGSNRAADEAVIVAQLEGGGAGNRLADEGRD